MQSPFALETHREHEDDPRWRVAARARIAILISAGSMVPLGAVMIITAILIADGNPGFPDHLTVLALVYPFAGGFCAMSGMWLHRRRFYTTSLMMTAGIQMSLFAAFWAGLVLWALG